MLNMNPKKSVIGRKSYSSIKSSQVPYNRNRFKSRANEEVYNQLSSIHLIMERKVQLEYPGEFYSFMQELDNKGCGTL